MADGLAASPFTSTWTETYQCGSLPYFELTSGTSWEKLVLVLRWAVGWSLLWYACALVAGVCVMPFLPPSKKPHENRWVFVGHQLMAEIKSIVISALANMTLVSGFQLPASLQLGSGNPLCEVAGILFTSYEVSILLLCMLHGLLDGEHAIHHIVHISLGFLIFFNCAPAFTAAALLGEETSGIPLYYFLLMRHRVGASSHWTVSASFVAFACCFFVWRLLVGSYGSLHYLWNYKEYVLPTSFPNWQAHMLGAILALASVLQWYWGLSIARSFQRRARSRAATRPRSRPKAL